MAAPALTYTLTNGQTADASQVMQNFNDLLNGISDGTKDISISALTCAGTATLNGHVNLGNSSADDLTITASLASSLPVKTNNTYGIGSSTLGLSGIYLGNGGAGATCRVISASHATTRTYTIPDCSAAANFLMSEGDQTVNGVLTYANGLKVDDDAGQSTLTYYRRAAVSLTFTFDGSGGSDTQNATIVRVGSLVTITFPAYRATTGTGSANFTAAAGSIPDWARPSIASPSFIAVRGRNNAGVDGSGPAKLTVVTDGSIILNRNNSDTAWTNGASAGFQNGFSVSYTVD